jgi:microcystin-dependent protein
MEPRTTHKVHGHAHAGEQRDERENRARLSTVAIPPHSHFLSSSNYSQICIATSKSPKTKVAQNLKLYNFLNINIFQFGLDFEI